MDNPTLHHRPTASGSSQQIQQQQPQQQQSSLPPHDQGMTDVDPEDPLLIAQSLTYVTDDGSVVMSFASAPFSFNFKFRFLILEVIFVLLCIAAVPIGAHSTVVSVSIANLMVVAWFWYNYVRSVDLSTEGGLRFWIGNEEVFVEWSKIVDIRRIAGECSLVSPSLLPHVGFLTNPTDGVAIVTSQPLPCYWPRSAGKPERVVCGLPCPRLVLVFSPAGGGLNFIRDVEQEMRAQGSASAPGPTAPKMVPPSVSVGPKVGPHPAVMAAAAAAGGGTAGSLGQGHVAMETGKTAEYFDV